MLAPKTNSEPRNLNFSLQKSQQTARFELNSITSFLAEQHLRKDGINETRLYSMWSAKQLKHVHSKAVVYITQLCSVSMVTGSTVTICIHL